MLQALRPLPKALAARPLELVPGRAPAGDTQLVVHMQRQEQSNWCWSAVGASIGMFRQTGAWTQCGVATASIPQFPGDPCHERHCQAGKYHNKSRSVP